MRDHRALRTRMNEESLRELIQTLLISELLEPSQRLWLVSPWVSKVPLIDNTAEQFRGLISGWETRMIRLDEILIELATRGTVVHICTRPDPENDAFVDAMQAAKQELPAFIHIFKRDVLHEKGLLTDHFYLAGSFNFTLTGITKSEDAANLELSLERRAEAKVALMERWKP